MPSPRHARSSGALNFFSKIRIFIILFVFSLPAGSSAQEPPATAPAEAATSTFQLKCSGCHTVGGGKLGDAPDLAVVAAWPRADLLAAIKRMEKNVGPLTDEEIAQLADLLLATDVRARLAAEQQRVLTQMRASLAPPDPAAGRALFRGAMPLANGGLACSSCHTANGEGGTFAVNLTGVFGRLGESGLTSAIQGANFPVMQAAYRARPVAPQEAMDLTAYFKSINPAAPPIAPARDTASVGLSGLALAVILGIPVALQARRRRPAGTRARLVRRATRSHER
jgi:mono/diheme cytochrome c family protein